MRLVSDSTRCAAPGHAGVLAGLTGSMVALVTPFRDGKVDGVVLAGLCERQIRAGTVALVVCGSTGEAPALSAAEQRLVIETAVAASRGRVPVIAGCGAPATGEAVARARDALRAGADALLCAPPPYSRPSQPGIAAHVQAVAAVGLPVMLYDVPARTGVAVADETVTALYQAGDIVALKDASGSLSRPARLRVLAGEGLRLYGGDDATTPAFLAMGGDGAVSVTANLVPRLCQGLQQAWAGGDLPAFAGLRDLLAPLHESLFQETNPIRVKTALALAGLCGPEVRLPLVRTAGRDSDGLWALLRPILGAEDACARPPALAVLR